MRTAWLTVLVVIVLAAAGITADKVFFSGSAPAAPAVGITLAEQGGAPNVAEDQATCSSQPVNCASGEFWEQFSDFSIPGLGIPLSLTRTYVSADAANQSPFGYGWYDSYGMSLTPPNSAGQVTVRQEDGAVVTFQAKGRRFTAPPRVMATLTRAPHGRYLFVRDADQVRFLFSKTGQLLSESDLNDNTTKLTYSKTQLIKVTDPSGRSLQFGYSGPYVTSVTAPMGATETLAYQGGNLVKVTDPAGRIWSFGYRGHLLTSMTDPRGLVTTIRYDAGQRVTQLRGPGQARTHWRYSGNSVSPHGGATKVTTTGGEVTIYRYTGLLLTSVTAAAGTPERAVTSYTHDTQALVTSVTDPDGHVSSFTYNPAGNLLTSTDPLGRVTTYDYNRYGEITTKISPGGATTRDWYDGAGNLIRTRDPVGDVTTYELDPVHPGLVGKITATGGRVTSMRYDDFGDTIAVITSPEPGTFDKTSYAYDAAGNVTCEASPDAVARHIACPAPSATCPVAATPHKTGTISFGLNCDGQVTQALDPSGDATSYRYNADGNIAVVTAPLGNVTSYGYNAAGQPTTVTKNGVVTSATTYYPTGAVKTQSSAPGQVTSYTYDRLGRVLTMTSPLGKVTSYSYDRAGNLIQTDDPAGQDSYYTYDAAGELTAVSFSAAAVPAVNYAYTPDGQPAQVSDATGTTTYTYDADQRLLSQTQTTASGASTSYSYSYNDAGNAVTLTYPNGQRVTSRYNTGGELTSVADWLGNVTTFHYDASGNLTTEDAPGVRVVYGPISITVDHQNTKLAEFAYARNKAGLLGAAGAIGVPRASGRVADYSYNRRGELSAIGSLTFGYDSSGNLVSSSSGFTQTFNAGGQLRSRDTSFSEPTDYSYDADGSLTSISSPGGGQPTSLDYNQMNWLTSVSAPHTTASYSYAGTGLLAYSDVNGAQTNFTWDQSQATPLLLATSSGTPVPGTTPASPSPSPSASPSASSSLSASASPHTSAKAKTSAKPKTAPGLPYTSYLYGPSGQPIEQISGSTATFLLADEQGSVRLLTSAAGREVGAISYGPFGNVTGRSGKVSSALGYDGQYTDPATGFIYLRSRYYDPGTGQFLTTDPEVSATGEPYSFAGNDPVNAVDPLGLSWWNPFTWTAKTWAAIGIGALLGIGAIFTDGADLALAPEALGLGADAVGVGAADAASVGVADTLGAAAEEGLADGGEQLAADAEGVNPDTVFSGHGSYYEADGYTTVPEGTSVATYTPHDEGLPNGVANDIETGNGPTPYKVYGPGDTIPNYTLHPIYDLPVKGAPVLVDQPTLLSDLLEPGMGTVHWAACTTVVAVC